MGYNCVNIETTEFEDNTTWSLAVSRLWDQQIVLILSLRYP